MRALLLIGHGSLRRASGAAMIRLAARLREAEVAPLVAAGFLNYSRPTLAQTLERLVHAGASDVLVMPYFLVPGSFTTRSLPRALAAIQRRYPDLPMRQLGCFGEHSALAELVLRRAGEVLPQTQQTKAALLLMAHGSPDASANAPLHALAQRIGAQGRFGAVLPCFLDLNQPSIPDAIAQLVQQGFGKIVALPYFLQLGGHVAEDLPQIIADQQAHYPDLSLMLAPHLGYDPLLIEVIRDRVSDFDRSF